VLKTKSEFPKRLVAHTHIHAHRSEYSIIYLIIYREDYYMMDAEHGVCNNRALCISVAL